MKKLLGNIFLGLVPSGIGIYTAYLFLKSLNDSPNWLFLLATLLLIGVGIFFLVRAGKADDSVIQKVQANASTNPSPVHSVSIIEQNNQIASDWNKTQTTRDQLKLLEAAGNAEEGK